MDWPYHEVNVIGHQASGEERHRKSLLCARDKREKLIVVRSLVEHLCLLIGSVQDVITGVGDDRPRGPWHAKKLSPQTPQRQSTNCCESAVMRCM